MLSKPIVDRCARLLQNFQSSNLTSAHVNTGGIEYNLSGKKQKENEGIKKTSFFPFSRRHWPCRNEQMRPIPDACRAHRTGSSDDDAVAHGWWRPIEFRRRPSGPAPLFRDARARTTGSGGGSDGPLAWPGHRAARGGNGRKGARPWPLDTSRRPFSTALGPAGTVRGAARTS
jgi:hypothetical protein